MGLKRRHCKSDKSYERSDTANLDRPKPEAVNLKMVPDPRRQSVTLRAVQQARKELHDLRVGVHGGEGGKVFISPGAEEKTRGAERRKKHRVLPSPTSPAHRSERLQVFQQIGKLSLGQLTKAGNCIGAMWGPARASRKVLERPS